MLKHEEDKNVSSGHVLKLSGLVFFDFGEIYLRKLLSPPIQQNAFTLLMQVSWGRVKAETSVVISRLAFIFIFSQTKFKYSVHSLLHVLPLDWNLIFHQVENL